MEKLQINREELSIFSKTSNLLSYHQDELGTFIESPFSCDAFEKQMNLKATNYSPENRSVLIKVLQDKYKLVAHSDAVQLHLNLLEKENTFTVTTGHQLNIFTGPIYLIYKILHTIRLSEELAMKYPNQHFVPVFWMASEDHDFEEIQEVKIFGNSLKWETEQKGAVGRFDFHSFDALKTEFSELFQNVEGNEISELLNAYQGETLSVATFKLIHHLFKTYGLIIVDGDDSRLKSLFSPIFKKEIESQFSFDCVDKTNQDLIEKGIDPHVYAREVNLFYLSDGIRNRIKFVNKLFEVDEVGTFTKDELIDLIDNHPERFSPNVVLRPLYQEVILPNLCYLGGGGEMAYWLQLKGVFDAVSVPYPLIQVRNSLVYIDPGTKKKMANYTFTDSDWLGDSQLLKKAYLAEHESDSIDFTDVDLLIKSLQEKFLEKTDSGSASWVGAELRKVEKQLESLQQRLLKESKKKHEKQLNQIDQIQDKLFPNRVFQERSINFFSLCQSGEVNKRLQELYQLIEPFGNDLIVFSNC
jgi:bacillithiol synthase